MSEFVWKTLRRMYQRARVARLLDRSLQAPSPTALTPVLNFGEVRPVVEAVYVPSVTDKLWFKGVTSFTAFCFTLFSFGGVAYADQHRAAVTREQRTREIAQRLDFDPQMVLEPEAYDRKQAAKAEKNRKAAVARMTKKYGPDPVKVAAAKERADKIKAVHLPSRLAGLGQALDEADRTIAQLDSGKLGEKERTYALGKLKALSITAKAGAKDVDAQVKGSVKDLPRFQPERRRIENQGKRVNERLNGFGAALDKAVGAAKQDGGRPDLAGVRKTLEGRKPAASKIPAILKTEPPVKMEPRTLGEKLWKEGSLTPEQREFYADVTGSGALVPTPAGLITPEELAAGFDPSTIPPVRYASLGGSVYDASELLLDEVQSVLPPPVAADLAETPDVRLTREVVQLAASLGNDPIRIYNYVHDTLDSEVYYGSRKGSEGARLTAAGNDFDLSSLLVALLRASNIPARYEYGSVALTPEQAMSWVGAQTPEAAASFFASAGFPGRVRYDAAGQLTEVQIEHVWVRAYVPYGNYRGLPPSSGEQVWVRLDPTLKRYAIQNGVDLRGAVHFDRASYLSILQQDMPLQVFEAQLRAHILATGIPCETLDRATVKRTLVPDRLEILPGDLPARIDSSLLVFADVPPAMRHRVRYEIGGFTHRLDLPAIFGKQVELRHPGATAADQALISAAGGVRYVAPYRVNVRPSLRVDGVEVALGSAVRPGTVEQLRATIEGPRFGYQPAVHRVTAGEIQALMVDAAGTPASVVADREAYLAARIAGSAAEEEVEAAQVQVSLARYFHESRRDQARLYALQRFGTFLDINEGNAGRALPATYLFGQPVAITAGNYIIDVTRGGSTPFSLDDDRAAPLRVELGLAAGFQGSAEEHRIWESTIHGQAISSVRMLQVASEQGVALLTIDNTNSATIASLPYPAVVREDLANLALQGLRITVPARPVSHGPFADVDAYVAEDLTTGAGYYRLFGTTNGGAGSGGANGGSSGGGCSCPSCCGSVGSQVDFAYGSYEFSETDLTLPAIGIPVVFARTYRSRTLQPVEGILGAQWQTTYDERLRFEADGAATFIDGGMIERRFSADAAGGFIRPPGYQASLAAAPGGHRLTAKDGSFRDFDAAGRLVGVEDANGNRLTVPRDAAGRPTEVRDALGRVALTFSYGADGLLASVTDLAGRVVRYERLGSDLTAAFDVLGHARRYEYDSAHRLVGRLDRLGNRTILNHDGQGRFTGLTDPLGNANGVAYDFENRGAIFTDKRGFSTAYDYNEVGSPIAVIDALGNRRQVEWDADRNRVAEVDSRGGRTGLTWDGSGNLLSRTDAAGAVSGYTYDARGHVLTFTDAAGAVTTNTYDAAGNLQLSSDAAGHPSAYVYDGRGLLQELHQAGGASTSFGYDSSGNIQTLTDPAGGVTVLGYDSAGHLTSLTDPNGGSRILTPDLAGRIVGVTDATGATTSFEYDEEGQRTAVIDAGGARSTSQFDAARRLIAATDALGNVTRTEYDEAGNVIARLDARGSRTTLSYDPVGRLTGVIDVEGHASTTLYCGDLGGQACSRIDPLGNVTEATFDALGRVLTTTDPNGNVTGQSYDSRGRRTTATDANGSTTSFGYDVLGRLTSVIDAQGNVIAYGYDARGNRTSVTDANGGVTVFDYDSATRLLSQTNPIGVTATFTYDAAGARATKTDGNGALTSFTYDGNRRLVGVAFADGTEYDFAFDPLGGRTLERSPSHQRGLAYDPLVRLQQVEDRTLGKTITYGYDASGNKNSMTLSTGEVTRYRSDGFGRPVELIDPDGETYRFFYDAAGRRSRVSFPNRTTASYSYTPAGEVRSIVYAGPAGDVLTAFHYSYDAAGNRLSKTFADGTAEVYGYDTLNRLTGVSYPSGRSVHYDLDPLGNRLALTETTSAGSSTETYAYNLFNQLLSVTGAGGVTTLEYDGNGNQLRKTEPGGGVTEYVWDLDNRLRGITLPGGETSSFEYDANGMRVRIENSAGARDQLLDGLSVAAEYNAAGVGTAWYNQSPAGIDELLSVVNTHGKHFVQTDALGSVYGLVDPAGAVAARADYDVFGARAEGLESLGMNRGFSGREHGEGDLNYHRARYASTRHGRWLSQDPAGFGDGLNVYLFVSASPVSFADPTGLGKAVVYYGEPVEDNDKNPLPLGGYAVRASYEQQLAQAVRTSGLLLPSNTGVIPISFAASSSQALADVAFATAGEGDPTVDQFLYVGHAADNVQRLIWGPGEFASPDELIDRIILFPAVVRVTLAGCTTIDSGFAQTTVDSPRIGASVYGIRENGQIHYTVDGKGLFTGMTLTGNVWEVTATKNYEPPSLGEHR